MCARSVTSLSVSGLHYLGLLVCMCALSLSGCMCFYHPGLSDVCAKSSQFTLGVN